MKTKMKLEKISIESFVTEIDEKNVDTVKGGITIPMTVTKIFTFLLGC